MKPCGHSAPTPGAWCSAEDACTVTDHPGVSDGDSAPPAHPLATTRTSRTASSHFHHGQKSLETPGKNFLATAAEQGFSFVLAN